MSGCELRFMNTRAYVMNNRRLFTIRSRTLPLCISSVPFTRVFSGLGGHHALIKKSPSEIINLNNDRANGATGLRQGEVPDTEVVVKNDRFTFLFSLKIIFVFSFFIFLIFLLSTVFFYVEDDFFFFFYRLEGFWKWQY